MGAFNQSGQRVAIQVNIPDAEDLKIEICRLAKKARIEMVNGEYSKAYEYLNEILSKVE